MRFDGDDLAIDERGLRADRHAIIRQEPDTDGLYVIGGYSWPWVQVDPSDRDRVVGQHCAP
jgi:hypothetical protein